MTNQDYPKYEFDLKTWNDTQYFAIGKDCWNVKTIWEAAKDLPIYEVPLIGFNTDIEPWACVGEDFMELCRHVKLIQKANLKYPIILTPAGTIADGRHRLAKALINGHSTIKIQRLMTMPEPDFVENEGSDLAYE